MRKIKFRGKTLDGRWIYGDLWHRPYAKDCVTIVSFMEDTGTTGGLEVIPETVGQYTGFKDKNGKDIYEGDTVKCTDGADEISKLNPDTGIGKIEWLEKWGFWSISNIENGLGDISNNGYVEVIGNIYENPGLMTLMRRKEKGGSE